MPGIASRIAGFSFVPLGLLSSPGWSGWPLALGYFLAIFLGQGVAVVLALRTPSLHAKDAGMPRSPVRLSIVIPAKDEAQDLALVLDDLRHQELPGTVSTEVIVVHAPSSDGTEEVARKHPSVTKAIAEPPLPPGWVGKNWACDRGYRSTSGDVLLFLDADVRLSPEALRAALSELEQRNVDLVTFGARVVMRSFWENVVLPLYTQFVLTYFMPHRSNRPGSRRAIANGQFLMITRARYEQIGGHERIRNYVLEDVKLAQEVKRSGGSIRFVWTPEMVTTRMYRDRKEMFEGLSKNVHGTEFRASRQVALLVGVVLLFLSPIVVLGMGLAYLSLPWTLVSLLAIFVTLLKQAAFQRSLQAPLRYAFTYPLGVVFYVAMLWRSLVRGVRGRGVTWKGRTYPTP